MKSSTFSFEPVNGWSIDEFPALDSEQTLVMVFASPEYMEQPSVLAELTGAFPRSKLIGCSTAGEISGSVVADTSLSVAVMQFERSGIDLASAKVKQSGDSFTAGKQLATQLNHSRLSAVFVLSDGLCINGSELIKGLCSTLPKNVIVAGGMAADGESFRRAWVIRNRRPESEAVVAVGLYGKHVRVSHGAQAGWHGFGPERHITRSDGNILYELDGKPALALYHDYLGERASGLPATAHLFPLSVRQDAGDVRPMARAMLAFDESNQSIRFAGDIPNGGLARLMRADIARLLESAGAAAEQARGGGAPGGHALAVAISSVGRRLALGERIEEEIEMTLARFPPGTGQVGFYSYGEISTHADGACALHNQAIAVTAFSEM